ncbi:TEL2, telomere maintenance protein 2 [Blomia tropicalis]|nr:TEL2, telomere maintenance protein 2 [Blomia tropicalis]
MYLMYYRDENNKRVYTLAKVDPHGRPTMSAHPARFSPEDRYAQQRIMIKKRFDFLSITCCYCQKVLCKDHGPAILHKCTPDIEIKKDELKQSKSDPNDYAKCNFCSDSVSILETINCMHCEKRFCLKHRHKTDHNCEFEFNDSQSNLVVEKLERKKYVENILKRMNLSTGVTIKNRGKKNDALALRVAEMKLRSTSVGQESIPVEERIYFFISFVPNENSFGQEGKMFRDKPMYLCREWSIGKCVDWLAKHFDLTNRNNDLTQPRLVLTNEQLLQSGIDQSVAETVKYCCDHQKTEMNYYICFGHELKELWFKVRRGKLSSMNLLIKVKRAVKSNCVVNKRSKGNNPSPSVDSFHDNAENHGNFNFEITHTPGKECKRNKQQMKVVAKKASVVKNDLSSLILPVNANKIQTQISSNLINKEVPKVSQLKNHSGNDRAIKVIDHTKLPDLIREEHLPKELEIIRVINHVNIIQTDMVLTELKNYSIIVSEFASQGDLVSYMERNENNPPSLSMVKKWFVETTNAIYYLHHKNIAHRDLKLDNILLCKGLIAKLADFGFAMYARDSRGKPILTEVFCGTTEYQAPETLLCEWAYDPIIADIFSLGIVLHVLVTRKFPFGKPDDFVTPEGVVELHKKILAKQWQKTGPIENDIDLHSLLVQLLNPDTQERIQIDQIEEIFEEVENYSCDEETESSRNFYTNYSSPKQIDRFILFIECILTKYQTESSKRDRLIKILTDCIYVDSNLADLIYATLDPSTEAVNRDSKCVAKFVTLLVSLPELIINLYRLHYPTEFTIKSYIPRLCTVLRFVLEQCYTNQRNLKLTQIREIVTRLCVKGHSEIVWNNLLKNICHQSFENTKWLQITQQIVLPDCGNGISLSPEQSITIEPVFKMFFMYSSCHKMVDTILNYSHLQSIAGKTNLLEKIKFLLTNKFLLINHVNTTDPSIYGSIDQFLLNIYTYLYTNNRDWLCTSIDNLLDTWTNSNAFKCRPYCQHFYFSRQLVIAAKLVYKDKDELSKKFTKYILSGTEIHLKSSQMEFRAIGLTASTIAINLFRKSFPVSIEAPKFEEIECNQNDDCDHLKKLAALDIDQVLNVVVKNVEIGYNIQTALLIDNSKKPPIYLQDCMDGLGQMDKPYWADKCLQAAEKIIRAHIISNEVSKQSKPIEYGRLNTVAHKFAKILFEMDNQLAIKNFKQLRMNALVALCVASPKIVAQYIGEQFYASNLSIANRLDVLTILTSASEELSRIRTNNQNKMVEPIMETLPQLQEPSKLDEKIQRKYFGIAYLEEEDDDDQSINDWRSIVSERILSNTRYFSGKSSSSSINDGNIYNQFTNQFVPVAGHFFFPLLRDPNKADIQLKLYEEDSFVLEHLFYSLGAMLQNCTNYPQVKLMSKELLQFIAPYRNHDDRKVRLSIIMVFKAVLQSTPHHYLFEELFQTITDFQLWLKEIIIVDNDQDCSYNAMLTMKFLIAIKR